MEYSKASHPPSPPPVYVREVAGTYPQPYMNPSPMYFQQSNQNYPGPSYSYAGYGYGYGYEYPNPMAYQEQGSRYSSSYPIATSQPAISRPMPLRPSISVYDRAENMGDRYSSELYGRCARGEHHATRKYGLVGIICAIVFFPLGLLCLCIDREKSCKRCGRRL